MNPGERSGKKVSIFARPKNLIMALLLVFQKCTIWQIWLKLPIKEKLCKSHDILGYTELILHSDC
jgi:hypothetical protein